MDADRKYIRVRRGYKTALVAGAEVLERHGLKPYRNYTLSAVMLEWDDTLTTSAIDREVEQAVEETQNTIDRELLKRF